MTKAIPTKSALFSKFKMDETREENGVWVDFGDDVKIKIRRLKAKASTDARAELDKPFANEIRRGTMNPETAKDLALKQVAKGVIADWKGINFPGEPMLPYTPENAYRILKALPELADNIIGIAADAEVFKAAMDADAEGNSSAS